jgi:hypothetical protein
LAIDSLIVLCWSAVPRRGEVVDSAQPIIDGRVGFFEFDLVDQLAALWTNGRR